MRLENVVQASRKEEKNKVLPRLLQRRPAKGKGDCGRKKACQGEIFVYNSDENGNQLGRRVMRIDILCKPENSRRGERTLENVREALAELGMEAEVHVFLDRRKMIDYRVYVSPAVLIDDNIRVSGRVPEVRELKSLFVERPRYMNRMNVA
jgi:hypothetical protein